MDDLPEKVVQIDVLRINRNMEKHCKCEQKTFVIDTANRSIYCGKCGAWVDPYEALLYLSEHYERLQYEVEGLLEQRKQIRNYKPWIRVIRELESQYRSKQMLPCCPRCGKPFFIEEISNWVNREMEELRRRRESQNK